MTHNHTAPGPATFIASRFPTPPPLRSYGRSVVTRHLVTIQSDAVITILNVRQQNGAVTAKKLANGAVSTTKLDRNAIGGSVRHWAQISTTGKVVASSSKAHIAGAPAQGGYAISWADTFSSRCAAIATPTASSLLIGPSSGYANARIEGVKPTSVVVDTYSAQGQPAPAAFSVAVIC